MGHACYPADLDAFATAEGGPGLSFVQARCSVTTCHNTRGPSANAIKLHRLRTKLFLVTRAVQQTSRVGSAQERGVYFTESICSRMQRSHLRCDAAAVRSPDSFFDLGWRVGREVAKVGSASCGIGPALASSTALCHVPLAPLDVGEQ